MSYLKTDPDKVRKFWGEIINGGNYPEFETAMFIADRAYTIDDISELSDDEIITVSELLQDFDTIYDEYLNDEFDKLINRERIVDEPQW